MKIVIRREREKTANYICFLAKGIVRDLYQKNGLYVIPYFSSNSRSVFFPDFHYSKEFWQLIKKTKNSDYIDGYPEKCVKEVLSKLPELKDPGLGTDYEKIIEKYKKELKNIRTLEIFETEYGTAGSYFATKDGIYLSQRSGNTPIHFERTLLLSICKHKNNDDGELGTLVYHKRLAVVEFMLGKMKVKASEKIRDDSKSYLQKLGFDVRYDPIKINTASFSIQEEELYKALLRHQGEVVDYDTIANVLWNDKSEDKYSLQAMAKVVENLRKKIRGQGINKELIFSKRGKGYFLSI